MRWPPPPPTPCPLTSFADGLIVPPPLIYTWKYPLRTRQLTTVCAHSAADVRPPSVRVLSWHLTGRPTCQPGSLHLPIARGSLADLIHVDSLRAVARHSLYCQARRVTGCGRCDSESPSRSPARRPAARRRADSRRLRTGPSLRACRAGAEPPRLSLTVQGRGLSEPYRTVPPGPGVRSDPLSLPVGRADRPARPPLGAGLSATGTEFHCH
eukprot:765328-Hanusia_phi.AAC.9